LTPTEPPNAIDLIKAIHLLPKPLLARKGEGRIIIYIIEGFFIIKLMRYTLILFLTTEYMISCAITTLSNIYLPLMKAYWLCFNSIHDEKY
jgi:hypothetical protein